MDMVSRKDWGARSPREVHATTWPNRRMVIFHHATGPDDVKGPDAALVRGIQRYHMDSRGWNDIGYNFLIGVGGDDDGKIYEGRGWLTIGAHCNGHNTEAIGVCFIGDFRHDQDPLTPAACEAASTVYLEACKRAGRKLEYAGHGRIPGQSTACPGDQVLAWIRERGPELDGKVQPKVPKTVGFGDTGAVVKKAQERLIYHLGTSALPRYGADGSFGKETLSATKQFQRKNGLVPDGVIGPKTWAALLKG